MRKVKVLAPTLGSMAPHLHLASTQERGQSPRPALPIQVVLADDHIVMRRGLRLLLEGEEDLRVVAEAADLSSVMHHVHGHAPHVLVLDLQMPHGSSLETIRRLRDQVPGTEIVVLTMERSPRFAQQALDAGAIGFVLKDRADTELPTAVRQAAVGVEYISPHVSAGVDALRRAVMGDGLSPRETEILRLIALGHTNAEIGAKLHLSRRTVETHRSHIHHKLGTTTRAELVRYGLSRHLIGG
jgi:two-component system response regulator NreC